MIEYDGNIEKTLLAYVLISTMTNTPSGAFVDYIVTCEKCIILNVMIHTKNNEGSVRNYGLCKKLVLLV